MLDLGRKKDTVNLRTKQGKMKIGFLRAVKED